jgi:hypothetical protein
LTKVSHPQKSHTSTAQGGLAAVDPRDPNDAIIPELHLRRSSDYGTHLTPWFSYGTV